MPILYAEDDLFREILQGNVDKVSALIAILGPSYCKACSKGWLFLCVALEREYTKIAKILLENGFKVNSKNTHTRIHTPLHLAVRNGNAEIVAMLLDRKANVDARNDLGETALHLSINTNNLKIVSLLLNKNANVNTKNNSGKTPLCRAIVEGNVEIVELLWRNSAYTHATYSKEIDALHIAADFGITKIVEHLLNSGAFVNVVYEKNGYTPLHCACAKGSKEIVKLLLKRGADINARTKKQSTALHLAAEKQSPTLNYAEKMKYDEIVKVLLEHNGVDIDAEDDRGKTVLNVAIEQSYLPTVKKIFEICPQVNNEKDRHCIRDYLCGPGKKGYRSPIVKTLLSHGFGVHPEDASNRKLLHIAVEEGCTKIVEDLLRYDADVDSLHVEQKGYTLLHNAAFNKKLDIAEILIRHGANVNAINETGSTPISYAIHNIDAKMTKLLVSSGAAIKFNPDILDYCISTNLKEIIEMMLNHDVDLDIMTKGKNGATALSYLVAFASPVNYAGDEDRRRIERDLAEMLLSRGAKGNGKDESVQDCLQRAIMGRRADLVEILLKHNFDVNSTSGIDMETPLHRSASIGNEEISRMLLNAGAASSAKDKTGKTPLHYACQSKCKDEYNEKIVDTLLEFGAEIDNKDSEDSTPLHIATINGYLEIVETLLKSFADVDCMDKDGKTALHIASKRRFPKIVEELLDYGADPDVPCKTGYSPWVYAIRGYHYLISDDHCLDSDSSDDDLDRRSDCVTTADMIKQHIIKLKSLNIHDSKQNLKFVEINDKFEDFQSECEREVGRMKNETIGETNISYYYVLMKSTNQLAMLARNKEVVEVMESSRYREKFPIYYKMLYYKFRKGQRREKLLNPSLKSFNFLLKFPLPELVSLKVLEGLSYEELKNLIKAVPETESR